VNNRAIILLLLLLLLLLPTTPPPSLLILLSSSPPYSLQDLIKEDMAWRRRNGIKDKSPEDLLGCPREIMDKHSFSVHLGNDPQDNDSPVIYRK